MLTNNFAMYGTKIFIELVGDIIFFPLWWYSRGLVMMSRGLLRFLTDRQRSLALLVWIKNIHRPMYGQRDWVGILISFLMRLFQVIIRGIAMLCWVAVALFLLCFWIFLPVFIFYEIVFQLS